MRPVVSVAATSRSSRRTKVPTQPRPARPSRTSSSVEVDAVVGPTSSLVALGALGDLMAADVLTCSPTASAQALDDYPDRDLFFRTVPSDSLQAAAIAGWPSRQAPGRRRSPTSMTSTGGHSPKRRWRRSRRAGSPSASSHSTHRRNRSPQRRRTCCQGEPGVIVVLADADAGIRLLSAIGEVAG